jgi:hypothetical protein
MASTSWVAFRLRIGINLAIPFSDLSAPPTSSWRHENFAILSEDTHGWSAGSRYFRGIGKKGRTARSRPNRVWSRLLVAAP